MVTRDSYVIAIAAPPSRFNFSCALTYSDSVSLHALFQRVVVVVCVRMRGQKDAM